MQRNYQNDNLKKIISLPYVSKIRWYFNNIFFLKISKKKKRLKKNAMIATKNDLEFMKHGI